MANEHDDALAQITYAWMKNWPRIVARSWADDGFRKQLMENPAGVAAAEGLPVLPGLHLKVESGSTHAVLSLPLPDKPADLSDENLNQVADTGVHPEASSQTCCC